MFVISTRNFPPEIGGMQNLMGGLANALINHGPVKVFAVTLGIGIITTLFSAYFFARHLTSLYVMKNKDKKITL